MVNLSEVIHIKQFENKSAAQMLEWGGENTPSLSFCLQKLGRKWLLSYTILRLPGEPGLKAHLRDSTSNPTKAGVLILWTDR